MGEFSSYKSATSDIVLETKTVVRILCQCNGADISPGMLVETIQTAGTDVDRYDITAGAADSKKILGVVDFSVENRKILGKTTENPTKATTFADNSDVWVVVRAPIVELILAAQQGTVLPGERLVSAATGTVKKHADSLVVDTHTTGETLTHTVTGYKIDPTVARALGRYTTSDATQRVIALWML